MTLEHRKGLEQVLILATKKILLLCRLKLAN